MGGRLRQKLFWKSRAPSGRETPDATHPRPTGTEHDDAVRLERAPCLCFTQFPYSTRTVPVQFPYSSHCDLLQFPSKRTLKEMGLAMLTLCNSNITGTAVNHNGNCTGTVRELYGYCTGAVNYRGFGAVVRAACCARFVRPTPVTHTTCTREDRSSARAVVPRNMSPQASGEGPGFLLESTQPQKVMQSSAGAVLCQNSPLPERVCLET